MLREFTFRLSVADLKPALTFSPLLRESLGVSSLMLVVKPLLKLTRFSSFRQHFFAIGRNTIRGQRCFGLIIPPGCKSQGRRCRASRVVYGRMSPVLHFVSRFQCIMEVVQDCIDVCSGFCSNPNYAFSSAVDPYSCST